MSTRLRQNKSTSSHVPWWEKIRMSEGRRHNIHKNSSYSNSSENLGRANESNNRRIQETTFVDRFESFVFSNIFCDQLILAVVWLMMMKIKSKSTFSSLRKVDVMNIPMENCLEQQKSSIIVFLKFSKIVFFFFRRSSFSANHLEEIEFLSHSRSKLPIIPAYNRK